MVSNWEPAHSLPEDSVSGAEIAAAPCLLTGCHMPASLFWYSLNLLFCEWARLCIRAFYGKVPFFSLSLVIPQFELLGHVSVPQIALRVFRPCPYSKNRLCSPCPLSSPCSPVADASAWLFVCWQLRLGAYSVAFFFFPSQLCCPLRFQNSPQTCWWEGFLLFGNFPSFMTSSPGWVSVPKSFVSYILSCLLSTRMGCIYGCLMSSASVQKLFCGSCSAFQWPFGKFEREKVVSPSYSLTSWDHPSGIDP